MTQLSTLLLAGVSVGFGVVLWNAVFGRLDPMQPLVSLRRRSTRLKVAAAILVFLLLMMPISIERIDAHDSVFCGSVLMQHRWEPSGLPGDRSLVCADAYRGRYVWMGAVAAFTALGLLVVALRRRRA